MLQKELMGCQKIIGQNSIKKEKKERFMSPSLLSIFQVQSLRNHSK